MFRSSYVSLEDKQHTLMVSYSHQGQTSEIEYYVSIVLTTFDHQSLDIVMRRQQILLYSLERPMTVAL